MAQSLRAEPETTLRIAETLLELGDFAQAMALSDSMLERDPKCAAARAIRGDAFNCQGKTEEAVRDYLAALDASATDEWLIKKACVCLHKLHRGRDAIALCERALATNPGLTVAKMGLAWALNQVVPPWHLPMMNELDRNQAYLEGIEAVVKPHSEVFEIGAGSGLLSLMAGRAGAQRVTACEAEELVAETANAVVLANHLEARVRIIAKPSYEVQLGVDLPERADVLVHEIFSSELISEHVLPAIEDAKARLLKPDAQIVPEAASVMIALVGGDLLGKYLHVDRVFGFDLSPFNRISPKKIPFYREDLTPEFLSPDIEAFRFDFRRDVHFPAETKSLEVVADRSGLAYGVIQWIRLDMNPKISFANHPRHPKAVSNWQHVVYRFDAPLAVASGQSVLISAAHDRQSLWFDLAVCHQG